VLQSDMLLELVFVLGVQDVLFSRSGVSLSKVVVASYKLALSETGVENPCQTR